MTQLLQTIVLGLLLGGVYALAASGLSLIFGVMRVVNIAHGAFLVLSAFLTYWLWDAFGVDPLLGIVLATPMMFALGWLTYRLVISPVRSAPVASTVLLSFGIALVLEGVMGQIWGNNSSAIRPSYADESFAMGRIFFPKAQVYGGLIAVIVLVLLWAVLTRTWLGRAIRAAATNPSSAELVGVRVASVAALVFGIGIAAAGAAGSITGVLYPFIPGSHYQWIARLLAIVVFGGMGSINGAVLGGLLFGVAETMASAYWSPAWSTAVPYAIVFAVLVIRPQGLLGTRLREDAVATA
ncbi:branched-chain amino acid ABC transporter permease [Streptomyces sp. NBC_00028]|uniref:branched-chain amino acid ABC transporter permease n=1 Tax=Streptomyces sp. NBC_00028 TaxID=2975624 RepID=UPI003255FFCD